MWVAVDHIHMFPRKQIAMNNHFKPKRVKPDAGRLIVVLFRSRNKDNQNIDGFHERFECMLTRREPTDIKIRRRFDDFVASGLPGERSRMYISVNARDNRKTMQALTTMLVDSAFNTDPNIGDIDMASLEQMAVSIAARPENAAEHKWLLDIDTNDSDKLGIIVGYLDDLDDQLVESINATPNGYHVIVHHGFDTRELKALAAYHHIDLDVKRDDLTIAAFKRNRLVLCKGLIHHVPSQCHHLD